MTSDVNKWRDLTQSLRQLYILLTFLYVKLSDLEYVMNRLSHKVLVIALIINPRPLSALELKL